MDDDSDPRFCAEFFRGLKAISQELFRLRAAAESGDSSMIPALSLLLPASSPPVGVVVPPPPLSAQSGLAISVAGDESASGGVQSVASQSAAAAGGSKPLSYYSSQSLAARLAKYAAFAKKPELARFVANLEEAVYDIEDEDEEDKEGRGAGGSAPASPSPSPSPGRGSVSGSPASHADRRTNSFSPQQSPRK